MRCKHLLECKHLRLRPIAVYSIWWRIYTSCWAKSSCVREWRKQNLPHQICGGKGDAGAEELAAGLLDSFHEQGFIASLDYSTCYDCVDPLLATGVMRQLGLPRQLTSVLAYTWSHQTRWLTWNDAVDPTPLFTNMGIPQGDGLSPVALNCLLTTGLRYVISECSHIPSKHCVYMDDRSWTSPSAQGVYDIQQAWNRWSEHIGLKENQTKTQCAALTARGRTQLTPLFNESHIKEHVEILGVCSSGRNRRKATSKEKDRQSAAQTLIRRAALLPVSRAAKHTTIRTCATSRATYGWVSRSPTQKENDDHEQAVWKACREPQFGGVHHKRLLLGLNLAAIVGISNVLRMLAMASKDTSRNADVLPSERHAFKWLTEHGWTKVGNRAWRHSGIRSLVSADPHWDSKVKDCQAHQLRESWRYCQWQHLCQGKRHQATEHRLEPYSEARCQMLRQITQTSSGPRRWLLLGAARSPMQIAKQRRTHVAPCIHHNCSVQEAGWHHIFWQCPARPAHLNVTGPHSGLLLRYGWLRTKDDEALLSHMEEEVTKIWQCCSCNAAADAADLRIDRCS